MEKSLVFIMSIITMKSWSLLEVALQNSREGGGRSRKKVMCGLTVTVLGHVSKCLHLKYQ